MALNLKVDQADAFRKFNQPGLVAMTSSGATTTGLPLSVPDVTIDPPDGESTRRTITWHLEASVIASNLSAIDAIERSISTLMSAVPDVADAAGGAVPDPKRVLELTSKTIRTFDEIWTQVPRVLHLAVIDLPIKYENRQGKPVTLTTKLAVNGYWMANDPTDSVNSAWIELENHQIDLDYDHKPKNKNKTKQDGRIPWNPERDDDFVGTFDQLLHTCSVERDRDSSEISFDTTVNVIADDRTVGVYVRSIKLELEIKAKEKERKKRRDR